MAFLYIDRDECIGDSLGKINDNAFNFDQRLITNTSNLSSLTTVVQTVSAGTFTAWEQLPSGINAGAGIAGSWIKRNLHQYSMHPNNLNATFDSANSRFTLPRGTWLIRASAPAYSVGRHMIRLMDLSAPATPIATGTSEFSIYRTNPNTTRSVLEHLHTIASSTTYYIEHYIEKIDPIRPTASLGPAANIPFTFERYTTVTCSKVG